MAGNAREPLFLLTTVDDTSAGERIRRFVEDAGGGAVSEETLISVWNTAKKDDNCVGVSFKGMTVLKATKLDKDGGTIGQPTVLPL